MLPSCRTLGSLYESEVAAEVAKHPPSHGAPISEGDLAGLPEPVRKYFRAGGFLGKPRMVNARLVWSELRLKRARDKDWLKVACRQFNSVPEPTRIALMNARMAGVLPFEGRDKYQDGHGNLRIKLLKVFTVGDSRGKEMDRSELVTVLSEALMVPSVALQPYIRWEPLDASSARATLTHGGESVSGTFHFNDAGELVRFHTRDRWQDGKPSRKIPWSAFLGGYRWANGTRFPTEVSATWHEEAGDFTYARGTLAAIQFDVTSTPGHSGASR
jgi:hypothetical protein